MKKSILINGKIVEYELVIKKVKNINLRIRSNGEITVSASKRVPIKVIENFLVQKSDFITKVLDKLSSTRENHSAENFENGDFLLLFGKKYEIVNMPSLRNCVEFSSDGKALIFTRDNSVEARKKAVLSLYERACEKEITIMCREVFEEFSAVVSTMPDIKFRKAKGRWGTCYSKANKIILNKLLAAAPTECIKYVIYHEFTHFIYPDHSKKFYGELERRVPNHKELKRILNSYYRAL